LICALEHLGGRRKRSGQNKSKEVRELLKVRPKSPEWTLPSRLTSNPLCFERS